MGTDAQTMAWFMDAYSMQEGETKAGVVTGKPTAVGGTHGREEAPGRTVAIVAREASAASIGVGYPRWLEQGWR